MKEYNVPFGSGPFKPYKSPKYRVTFDRIMNRKYATHMGDPRSYEDFLTQEPGLDNRVLTYDTDITDILKHQILKDIMAEEDAKFTKTAEEVINGNN